MLDADISRRRVVQGAVWATPAVLVATALPAAAASPPVLGGVVITGASAAMNTANFFVTATLAYAGDGPPHADHPVGTVRFTVTLPTSRVVAGTPGVTALGWSYVGSAPQGANTVYTFAWNGQDLSSAQPATQQVTVKIPATASIDPINIPLNATGISNGLSVPATSVVVSAGVGADLVVDNASIGFITWMPKPGGGQQNGYRMQGQGRWAGPYYPVGGSISNLLLVIRIPAAYTDGTYQVETLGAGWSLNQAPFLTEGVYQASWVFNGTIGQNNHSTTGWDIRFKALGAQHNNAVTSALYGVAGGSPNYFSWTGPTS
ncbi:hypothetical protein [Demequina sp.]|uniref:hypothetical protein n=1 Tax=Demequina sp. TaxID=2050685 RepID=UPI003D1420F6